MIGDGEQRLMHLTQPFQFIGKGNSGVGLSSAHLMGHQQIAVPIKPMGDYIPLVASKPDILRHIRENKVCTVINTGTEVVKLVVIELRQPRPSLRLCKKPAFKLCLNLRLLFTGEDGFLFVQDVFHLVLAVFIHILHPVLYLDKAEV